MSARFSLDAKIKGVAAFIATMHEEAGCDAAELKRLFAPKIIDAVVAMCAEKKRPEGMRERPAFLDAKLIHPEIGGKRYRIAYLQNEPEGAKK